MAASGIEAAISCLITKGQPKLLNIYIDCAGIGLVPMFEDTVASWRYRGLSLALMDNPVVLFDGVCNFCNSAVNFLIRQDNGKVFRFAALQSEAGQKLLEQYQLSKADFDSFILIDDGKAYKSSTAALRLSNKLPWYWRWTQLFWIIPKPVRDAVYGLIARNRYKWFGKKEECMLPTPDVRSRFL